MKTIFVGFIAMIMAMIVLGGTAVAAIPALPGDYDGDGGVTRSDLQAYSADMRWYQGAIQLNENGTIEGDVILSSHEGVVYPDMNGDGAFTHADVEILNRIYKVRRGSSDGDVLHTIVVGDVNGDGVFDINDQTQLMSGTWHYSGNYICLYIPSIQLHQFTRTV